MAREIEKKYLVHKDKLPSLKKGKLYIQGYLCLSPLIRYRIDGNQVCLNIKKINTDTIIREEWEFFNSLDTDEINELTKLSIKKPIKKIRYKIKYKRLTWEVDVYQGDNRGLVTAEVELPRKDYPISFPEWIDNQKDISDDEKYFNKNLGDFPYKLFKKNL